jgi:hypothetical protein
MKLSILMTAVAGMIIAPCALVGQVPAGATGQCKDGTYTTASSKQGACRGHKGVATWFAEASPAGKSQPSKTAPTPASSPAPAASQAATGSAGATGQCKDGTYTTAASKQGACRGHKGVATWYAEASGSAKPQLSKVAPASSSSPVSTPVPQPVTQPAPAAARTVPAYTPPPPQAKPAQTSSPMQAGGGPGLVWVNTPSNVYHCYGTRFYGTTKSGRYMTEADARAAGARPDHNTPCSK